MKTTLAIALLALLVLMSGSPTVSAATISCDSGTYGWEHSDTHCSTSGLSGVNDTTVDCWSHSYADHYEAGCKQTGAVPVVGGSCITVSYDGQQHPCDNLT